MLEELTGTSDGNAVVTRQKNSDPLYVCITCGPSASGCAYVTVRMSASAVGSVSDWDNIDPCWTLTASDHEVDGGRIGFAARSYWPTVDDLSVYLWQSNAWQLQVVEDFDLASGYARPTLTHDAAGNLTYDGNYKFKYDPDSRENRLVRVYRAYRDSGDTLQTTSKVATITYDGLGRRISKFLARKHQLRRLERHVPLLLRRAAHLSAVLSDVASAKPEAGGEG